MDIDKLYRVAGNLIKSLFKKTIIKPVQKFNVDNRAQRKIEPKNLKRAPWHETTVKLINEMKKPDTIKTLNEKNENLVDRLKSVKVDSKDDPDHNNNNNEQKQQYSLPQDRIGTVLPFVFYQPQDMPIGKITVLDIVDILLGYKNDKRTIDDIINEYQLSTDNNDIKNLLKYLDVFVAIDEDENIIQLFSKRESTEKITQG